MIKIIEISQIRFWGSYNEPIYAYSENGRQRAIPSHWAEGAVKAAKKRFNWYFCPFDDVVLDYRFKR